MDAIGLLKADHERLNAFLKELAHTTPRGEKIRTELLAKVRKEIEIHMAIEEEIFYPALRSAGQNEDDAIMYYEALEEHRAARDLVLPDLLGSDVGSTSFGGRAKVLKELVKHHADEEEDDMFPRARELLDSSTLQELGERMAARKSELGA
jgi:hemerythrin-like domain-containing protein